MTQDLTKPLTVEGILNDFDEKAKIYRHDDPSLGSSRFMVGFEVYNLFVKDIIHKAYQAGRDSILKEMREEQKKFLGGFAYKKGND
ncbi:hypothetical protein HY469_02515 [Candidatus Roizmanbacteria bacterium]|nr:hypothetical protein [Candidatus Roizmanbacteria bacterium]